MRRSRAPPTVAPVWKMFRRKVPIFYKLPPHAADQMRWFLCFFMFVFFDFYIVLLLHFSIFVLSNFCILIFFCMLVFLHCCILVFVLHFRVFFAPPCWGSDEKMIVIVPESVTVIFVSSYAIAWFGRFGYIPKSISKVKSKDYYLLFDFCSVFYVLLIGRIICRRLIQCQDQNQDHDNQVNKVEDRYDLFYVSSANIGICIFFVFCRQSIQDQDQHRHRPRPRSMGWKRWGPLRLVLGFFCWHRINGSQCEGITISPLPHNTHIHRITAVSPK